MATYDANALPAPAAPGGALHYRARHNAAVRGAASSGETVTVTVYVPAGGSHVDGGARATTRVDGVTPGS